MYISIYLSAYLSIYLTIYLYVLKVSEGTYILARLQVLNSFPERTQIPYNTLTYMYTIYIH